MKLLNIFKAFKKDESGAVTVDWVVLTAAIVGLGMVVMTSCWRLASPVWPARLPPTSTFVTQVTKTSNSRRKPDRRGRLIQGGLLHLQTTAIDKRFPRIGPELATIAG